MLLVLLGLTRCDCSSGLAVRDTGQLVMLDTGGQGGDACPDAGDGDAPSLDHSAGDLWDLDRRRDVGVGPDQGSVDSTTGADSSSALDAPPVADQHVDSSDTTDATPGLDATEATDLQNPDASSCASTCVPVANECHVCVDILIDNFCNTSVAPAAVDVPVDTTLTLTFVNRSEDYAADVWSSRGYGFIELPTGATWEDPIWHCTGPTVYTEYFDVSIYGGGTSSCPAQRFNMHCQ